MPQPQEKPPAPDAHAASDGPASDNPAPDSPADSVARATLPVPRSAAGRAGLAAIVADPGRSLIGLDFDGTLAPIVAQPADARALPGAVAALRRLSSLTGTLAVITGRPAREAVEYADLTSVPGIVVLGHYGRQRWTGGTLTTPPPPAGLAAARAGLPDVLTQAVAAEGTWVEDKGDALAVHTRQTADPSRALDQLREPLEQLAARTGLAVEPGRMVIELRPPGADKGRALRDLTAERHPSGILYCGDDLGDRPAFAAAVELRAEGIPGLTVCSGSTEVAGLADEADLVVDGPEGVVGLLTALADAFSGQGG